MVFLAPAAFGAKAAEEVMMSPVKEGLKWLWGGKKGQGAQGAQARAPGGIAPMAPIPANSAAQRLGLAMMANGASTAPVQGGPFAALARALQGPLGAYVSQQAQGQAGQPAVPPPPSADTNAALQPTLPSTRPANLPQGATQGPYGPMGSGQFPIDKLDAAGQVVQSTPGSMQPPDQGTPGQARGRTVGAMIPDPEDSGMTNIEEQRAAGENAANEAGFIVLGPAPNGGYRVQDPKTGRTGTWQP